MVEAITRGSDKLILSAPAGLIAGVPVNIRFIVQNYTTLIVRVKEISRQSAGCVNLQKTSIP